MVLYGPPAMFAPPAEKLANQDHQNENKPDDEEEKKKQVAGESPSSTAIILHPSPSPADAAPKPPASEEGYGPSQLPAVDAASFPAGAAETPELKAAACRSISSPSSSSSGATFSLSLAPTSAISSPTVAYSTQGQLIGTSPADREATMTLEEALRSETPLILRAEQDAELQQLLARYQALTEQLLAHPEQQPELQQLAVQVSRLHEGARSGPPFASESMTLGHFMQHHFGDDTRFYLQQLPIHQFDPLLAYFGEQVRSVPFGIAAKELMCGMFAGGPGITTSLHYDRKHFDHGEAPVSNIFVQVSGTKRFELLHPSHSPALYARGQPLPASACRPGSTGLQAAGTPEDLLPAPIASSPHVSRLGKIDAATFSSPEATSAWPGFADAYSQRIVVELSPGDCLYLPPRWWHATFSTSSGTALNWWFTPLPHASS